MFFYKFIKFQICFSKMFIRLYTQNVYRISESSHTYKEIMQTGLECIGNITEKEVLEVTSLAAESLKAISENFVLHVAHIGLVNALLEEYDVEKEIAQADAKAFIDKLTEAGLVK